MTNDEAMVERVARAIHKACRQIAPGFPGDYLNDGNRFSDEGIAHERLMAQARAAIEAISASGAEPVALLHESKPGPEWRYAIGDPVQKTKGSSWHGYVVGFYTTTLTPRGYAVETMNFASSFADSLGSSRIRV